MAAKKVAPRVSLPMLAVAAQFLDLLWPVLLLAGKEHVRITPGITRVTPLDFYDYPISHSLLTSVAFGIGLALLYWSAPRRRSPVAGRESSGEPGIRAALVIAALVPSHWVLDWLTHRPDLPLVPWGGPKVGLGLWNSVVGTIAVESAMFFFGVWVYVNAVRLYD